MPELIEMSCSVCGGTADVMAVHQGKVVCFSCLVARYPDLAATLVRYLAEFKGVKLT
jgi:hypothetical protein